MAKSVGRKQVFIVALLAFFAAGVAVLVFRDIPVTQTEKTVTINHADLTQ